MKGVIRGLVIFSPASYYCFRVATARAKNVAQRTYPRTTRQNCRAAIVCHLYELNLWYVLQ